MELVQVGSFWDLCVECNFQCGLNSYENVLTLIGSGYSAKPCSKGSSMIIIIFTCVQTRSWGWVWHKFLLFKGTTHLQIVLLKYVMLITVNKHSIMIIANYTWYHGYKEIIKITGGSPLLDSKVRRRKVKCSDVAWPRSQLVHKFT